MSTPTSPSAPRYGMTVPLHGPLGSQREQVQRIAELGYTDLWSAEGVGPDGFTPLVLASQWAPEMRLGTAIIPAFTRGPGVARRDRRLGLAGCAGKVHPRPWHLVERDRSRTGNSIPFEDPYKRIRDLVAFLRAAMSGEKVTESYDTFAVKGFRLQTKPAAARCPSTLRRCARACCAWPVGPVTGSSSTGCRRKIYRRCSPSWPTPRKGRSARSVARLFVLPSEDREKVLETARFLIAAYISVPVYRAFHDWMGRGDALAGFHERWGAGDRKGALLEIPESIVDDLVINGSWAECRAGIKKYFDAGLDTASISLLPSPDLDPVQSIAELAPGA